jgi:hypothetical protein
VRAAPRRISAQRGVDGPGVPYEALPCVRWRRRRQVGGLEAGGGGGDEPSGTNGGRGGGGESGTDKGGPDYKAKEGGGRAAAADRGLAAAGAARAASPATATGEAGGRGDVIEGDEEGDEEWDEEAGGAGLEAAEAYVGRADDPPLPVAAALWAASEAAAAAAGRLSLVHVRSEYDGDAGGAGGGRGGKDGGRVRRGLGCARAACAARMGGVVGGSVDTGKGRRGLGRVHLPSADVVRRAAWAACSAGRHVLQTTCCTSSRRAAQAPLCSPFSRHMPHRAPPVAARQRRRGPLGPMAVRQ